MKTSKNLLATAYLAGTIGCLPSNLPETTVPEITIPGETVKFADKGYSQDYKIRPLVPPLSELVQKIHKNCSHHGCLPDFSEDPIIISYRGFDSYLFNSSNTLEECVTVSIGLGGKGKFSGDWISMTDCKPFGSVNQVYLVRVPSLEEVGVPSEEVAKFDQLYEGSILLGFAYEGKHGPILPKDLKKNYQKLYSKYFVMP